eukprot:m.289404 g.289404  ORF g.289404 m.289404 type:complete len:1230 (-) comp15809_c0_seq12:4215-7904(-)
MDVCTKNVHDWCLGAVVLVAWVLAVPQFVIGRNISDIQANEAACRAAGCIPRAASDAIPVPHFECIDLSFQKWNEMNDCNATLANTSTVVIQFSSQHLANIAPHGMLHNQAIHTVHLDVGPDTHMEEIARAFMSPDGTFPSILPLRHLHVRLPPTPIYPLDAFYSVMVHLPRLETVHFYGHRNDIGTRYTELPHIFRPPAPKDDVPLLSIREANFYQVTLTTLQELAVLRNAVKIQFQSCGIVSQLNDIPGLNLTQLSTLEFINCNLRSISGQPFVGLSHLNTLRLPNNVLTTLPTTAFSGLLSLQLLDLHENLLTSLHPGVFQPLTSLQKLYLGKNLFTSIEKQWLRGLSSLNLLHLDQNRIMKLHPNLLETLTSLERVYFRTNHVTLIPARLFQTATRLKVLHAEQNELVRIDPSAFDNNKNLQRVYFDGNKLRSIPNFENSPITLFSAPHNDIRNVPASFLKVVGDTLQELVVPHNKIGSIDDDICLQAPNLTVLHLFANALTTLPESIFECKQLRELRLAANRLHHLPLPSHPLPNLRVLGARFNRLVANHHRHASILDRDVDLNSLLPNLHEFRLGWNKDLEFFPATLPFHLSVLSLERLKEHLDLNSINNPKKLSILAIGHQRLSLLPNISQILMPFGTFSLEDTVFENLDLRPNVFASLTVTANPKLKQLIVWTPETLVVSDNPQLEGLQLKRGAARFLNISNTNLSALSLRFCRVHGSVEMVARAMKHESWQQEAEFMLHLCYFQLQVPRLDFTGTFQGTLADWRKWLGQALVLRDLTTADVSRVGWDGYTAFAADEAPEIELSLPQGMTLARNITFETVYALRDGQRDYQHPHLLQKLSFAMSCKQLFYEGKENCRSLMAAVIVGSVLIGLVFAASAWLVYLKFSVLYKHISSKKAEVGYAQMECQDLQSTWIMRAEDVQTDNLLGSHGNVWSGRSQGIDVGLAFKYFPSVPKNKRNDIVDELRELCTDLRHKLLVHLFGAGPSADEGPGPSADEGPFIAMECFVRGSLKQYLYHDGEMHRVSWATQAQLACDIAAAANFLHAREIPLGVITSENVFVSEAPFRAKIAPFGKVQRSVHTSMWDMITITHLQYLSPQALDENCSWPSVLDDVFCVGVLIWEILTKQPPDLLKELPGVTVPTEISEYRQAQKKALMAGHELACDVTAFSRRQTSMVAVIKGALKILPNERTSLASIQLTLNGVVQSASEQVPTSMSVESYSV